MLRDQIGLESIPCRGVRFRQTRLLRLLRGRHQLGVVWSNLFRDEPFGLDDLARTDVTPLKDELLARFGHYHQPIPSLISYSTNVLQLNVYDIRSLPTWHRGRVVLIGDAAHAVSPNSGQGAPLALEDAMYLARLLRDQPYEAAFAQFERDRRPRAEKVVAEGRFTQRGA